MPCNGDKIGALTVAINNFCEFDMPSLKRLVKHIEILNNFGVTSADINRLAEAIEEQNRIALESMHRKNVQTNKPTEATLTLTPLNR